MGLLALFPHFCLFTSFWAMATNVAMAKMYNNLTYRDIYGQSLCYMQFVYVFHHRKGIFHQNIQKCVKIWSKIGPPNFITIFGQNVKGHRKIFDGYSRIFSKIVVRTFSPFINYAFLQKKSRRLRKVGKFYTILQNGYICSHCPYQG